MEKISNKMIPRKRHTMPVLPARIVQLKAACQGFFSCVKLTEIGWPVFLPKILMTSVMIKSTAAMANSAK